MAQLVEEVFARGRHRAAVADARGRLRGVVSQSDVVRVLADP